VDRYLAQAVARVAERAGLAGDTAARAEGAHACAERGCLSSRSAASGPGHRALAPALEPVKAQAAGENFPVASRLLPRRRRDHLWALYAFARVVDDIGDRASGDRGALLDAVERELDLVYRAEPTWPLMRALAATVSACAIPRDPLQALISANRQDQRVSSYDTFAQLLAYCELSANPVGHLVLYVFGAATPERILLSDRICTALQLVEHWQDVVEDLQRGRVYLPAEDLERFGCAPLDLAVRPAPERVRELIRFELERTRAILGAGAPLIGTLRGRPRLAVAAFVAGGGSAIRAIERRDCDVSAGPPRATRALRALATLSALLAPGRSIR
jgi:squalene synthase HpnC